MNYTNDKAGNSGWLQFCKNGNSSNPNLPMAAALLHSMEESLSCFLCKDIYQIPVSIQPCHHAFCNECIRKEFAAQQEKEGANSSKRCPICHTPLDPDIDPSKSIVLNRSFEETARQYKTLRPILKSALGGAQPPPTATRAPNIALMAAGPQFLKPPGTMSKRVPRLPVKRPQEQPSPLPAAKRSPTPRTGKPQEFNSSGIKRNFNNWIRDQFTVEWWEALETWNFNCKRCNETAMRSKKQTWNATKLTVHILHQCTSASESLKAEALSHSRHCKAIDRTAKNKSVNGERAEQEGEDGQDSWGNVGEDDEDKE